MHIGICYFLEETIYPGGGTCEGDEEALQIESG